MSRTSDPLALYLTQLAAANCAVNAARGGCTRQEREAALRLAIDYLDAALVLLPELEPPPPAPALGAIDDEVC
jgi:hypothetical protein